MPLQVREPLRSSVLPTELPRTGSRRERWIHGAVPVSRNPQNTGARSAPRKLLPREGLPEVFVPHNLLSAAAIAWNSLLRRTISGLPKHQLLSLRICERHLLISEVLFHPSTLRRRLSVSA